jgi:hypothetical protein
MLATLDQNSTDHLWDMLQQPAHPGEVEPRYRLLRSALEAGWQVEEPVYLRPRWGDGGPRVYHFILRLNPYHPPRLLTVPESPEVERFVEQEDLRVVKGY